MATTIAAPATLTGTSATELVGLIRRGDVSARDVIDAHIARIEQVDATLNAVVVRRFDEARAEASAADAARMAGRPLGPLHGLPITIKEQFLVAGTPTTLGLLKQAGHRADHDGPSVRRLRAAGAIILGKTNVGQLLMYLESDNPLYGRTNNPWHPDRTPGGSSGGEAAIIAAGGSPLGLGGDLGGSLRVPAHFSGIAALKPTSGRLSVLDTPPGFFFEQDIIRYQPGPMARRVADLALAMTVLTAAEPGESDPTVERRAWPDPSLVGLRGLRIGAYDDDGWFAASPAIRRAVAESARALEDAGATVQPFRPPDVGSALSLFLATLGGDGLRSLREALRGEAVDPHLQGFIASTKIPGPIRPLVAALMQATGRPHYAQAIRANKPWSVERMEALADEVGRYRTNFLAALDGAELDALVCPPWALPALTHGAGVDLTVNTAGSYATLFNVLEYPAGVVPVTRVRPGEESDRPPGRGVLTREALKSERGSQGLPIGVQVAARPWREDIVLSIMAMLESAFAGRPDYPTTPVS